MPKQIWQTFDGLTWSDEAEARDHEDKAFAAAIDGKQMVSALDVFNAAETKQTLLDTNSVRFDSITPTDSERSIIERVLRRLLIS